MSFHRISNKSIISSCEPESPCVDSSDANRNYNKPLINSAVTTNDMSDEQIARQQQERLYNESFMDVDEPTVAAALSFDTRTSEEIEADAAFARQLQEEEYSRNSILPPRSYQHGPNDEKFLPFVIDPEDRSTFTDAELAAQLQTDAEIAAQLQADEEKNQRRHRQRPAFPSQRRISHQTANRTDEPEVIPFPFTARPTRQRSSSNGNNDLLNLLQIFTPRGQSTSRGGRGIQNLQNIDRDFGPDDYENLLELDNSSEKKPLTTDEINRLPTEKFRSTAIKNDEENKCNICWDQFEKDQTLRRLTCLHRYHKDCIDPWLQKSNVCPICRNATN